jgi:type IV pilus assembly protein PilY1
VRFRWPANTAALTSTDIDATLVTALNKNASGVVDGYGAQRLEWLRGNTARENRLCLTCSAPVFRGRPASVLGDIVNSAPLYFNGSGRYIREGSEASSYSSYKSARMAKTPLVFVGANDGMLHAFNATTGDEVFAYVPAAVTARLSQLTAPAYSHRYTVDGALVAGDVFYASAWHSVLVGGMGAGAKGLFALDISDPALMDEAHASSVVRWETASDSDVGYIFGEPVLAKMKNGRWMAIVGNGYNSSSGVAKLLLIDVETGALTKVSTQSGSTTAPNGLSTVVAVSSANNGVADIVYAGDLAGNLWKFDLSSTSTSSWAVAYSSGGVPAPLYAAGGNQPITARPDVSVHPSGGYMVVFGTGRYIDVGDDATTLGQSVYGLWDSGSSITSSTSLVSQSVLGTTSGADARTYRMTTFAVGSPGGTVYTGDNAISAASYASTKRGWKINLPAVGERVVTQAAVRYGKVVVSTLIPSADACAAGGDGWVMELDLTTGNRPNSPALDSNGDNNVGTSDILSYGGGSAYASGVRVGAIPAAPGFIRAQNRRLDDKLVNTSNGSIVRIREAGSSTRSGRVSWEQLQ